MTTTTDYKKLAEEALKREPYAPCPTCKGEGRLSTDETPVCETCNGTGEIAVSFFLVARGLAHAVIALNTENRRLRAALTYYAGEDVDAADYYSNTIDGGYCAREALDRK